MKKYVDEKLTANPAINDIIGHNTLKIMYDNHNNHIFFMTTVFSIDNYELLAKTIPWVYHAYTSHGFSEKYFPLELNTWIEAIDKYMDKNKTSEIKAVYQCMIDNHENMINISKNEKKIPAPINDQWLEAKNEFLSAILEGEHNKCLNLATNIIKTDKNIEHLYLYIIQPVMYEIGMLWERGSISVAQEHLASAIVGRIMASINLMENTSENNPHKAVITSAPNEFHEIGGWMISDILEHDGWNVRYLGANTPAEDLFEMLRSFKPDVLAICVTMPFNILKVKDIIKAVKADKELNKIKTVVGGQTFNENKDLWRSTGADCFAANAQETKTLLKAC